MPLEPRRLLTFRVVARERSFSAAARALALTQPAVSQQVAALERQAGVRLLEREPGGLRLTPAGSVLLGHADAVADRLSLADAQLAALAGEGRSRLRVGAFPSALATLVPAAIAALRASDGDAEVLAEEGGSEALAAAVRTGRLHMALDFQDAVQPRREEAGLERRDLLREPFLVALPPEHPLAAGPTVDLRALARERWTAASTDRLVARTCRAAGFEPRIVSLTRDPMAIRALVARGLAVALVPRLLAQELPGIAIRPLAADPPERDVYALVPPGERHPLVPAFIDAARPDPPLR